MVRRRVRDRPDEPVFRPLWPGHVPSYGYQVGVWVEAELHVVLTDDQIGRLLELLRFDPETGLPVNLATGP